jgi:hypothetical protein
MAWSNSKIFRQFIADVFTHTAAFSLASDTLKASLFDNTITPAQDVSAANSAYAAGVWASGGVSDSSGWPAAGRALTTTAVDTGTAYGVLVHDTTLTTPVSDQGVCFCYLGGANSVTSGSFTVVWDATNGVLKISL